MLQPLYILDRHTDIAGRAQMQRITDALETAHARWTPDSGDHRDYLETLAAAAHDALREATA